MERARRKSMWYTYLTTYSIREMKNLLCDELLVKIFQKLPLSSCSSVSLVSKCWLHLYRTFKSTLSLQLTFFCY
uniref:F-box domain-containing protein n=1 Tax=Cannabis sativa TaxID=3483 RepID=A0A803R0Z6_CANSA